MKPPESRLLCCFDSFFVIYPVFVILPLVVSFPGYLGHYLAQSVNVPVFHKTGHFGAWWGRGVGTQILTQINSMQPCCTEVAASVCLLPQRRCQSRQFPPFTGLNTHLWVDKLHTKPRPGAYISTWEGLCFLVYLQVPALSDFQTPPDCCRAWSASVVATYP